MNLNDTIRSLEHKALDFLGENSFGRKLIAYLGEPYVAGHSLQEGIERAILEFNKNSRYGTLDILGEGARTEAKSQEYVNAYKQLITMVDDNRVGGEAIASVSLKPSALIVVDEKGLPTNQGSSLQERLEDLVSYAKAREVQITIDMEDHDWTDITLEAAKEVWRKGYDNLGIVLQSRLNRTRNDVSDLFGDTSYTLVPKGKMRVRACIGIYNEHADIAVTDREEAKDRLIDRQRELFQAGIYVESATHDHKRIRQTETQMEELRVPKEMHEFQFLLGVQNAYNIDHELRDRGHKVRYYMPVELNKGDGVKYMIRRLKANPEMITHGIKNTLQRIYSLFSKNQAYQKAV